MKSTIGIVLIVCMPFIAGGLFLLVLKLQEVYAHRKYERAVEMRNSKIERLGLKPFRGTKQYVNDNHDYSADRDWFKDRKGVWK